MEITSKSYLSLSLDHYLYDCSYDFANGKVGYLSNGTYGNHIPEELALATREVVKSFKEGKIKDAMDVEPAREIRYRSYGNIPQLYKSYAGKINSIFQAEFNQKMRSLKCVSERKVSSETRKVMKRLENFAYALTCYHHDVTGEWIDTIIYEKEGTHFFKASSDMDAGKSKKYWSTTIEMFARAFESYVDYKIYEKEERSDYLVCGINGPVYPQQKEEAANIFIKMEHFRLAVSSFMRGDVKHETFAS